MPNPPRNDIMYGLTVRRSFPARHYLTVPDPGPEGQLHTHEYEVVVRLTGEHLDEHGYLVDIDEVQRAIDHLDGRYRGAVLNDLPEFDKRNPSVERFARAFSDRLLDRFETALVESARITMWEDENAAASFERRV